MTESDGSGTQSDLTMFGHYSGRDCACFYCRKERASVYLQTPDWLAEINATGYRREGRKRRERERGRE